MSRTVIEPATEANRDAIHSSGGLRIDGTGALVHIRIALGQQTPRD